MRTGLYQFVTILSCGCRNRTRLVQVVRIERREDETLAEFVTRYYDEVGRK